MNAKKNLIKTVKKQMLTQAVHVIMKKKKKNAVKNQMKETMKKNQH